MTEQTLPTFCFRCGAEIPVHGEPCADCEHKGLYRWTLSTNGKWWILNEDENYAVRTKPTPGKGYLAIGKARAAYYGTIGEGQALVEGLYDHYSLPASKRWLTL